MKAHRREFTLMIRAAFVGLGLAALALALTPAAQAAEPASPVGVWQTVDDRTGQPRALVRIYQQDGRLFGRIERSFTPGAESRACDACKDERHGQPMLGLVIIRNLAVNGDTWDGGDILDPDSGTVYRCKLRLDDNGAKLVVRGFIGVSLLGRSQTWIRQK